MAIFRHVDTLAYCFQETLIIIWYHGCITICCLIETQRRSSGAYTGWKTSFLKDLSTNLLWPCVSFPCAGDFSAITWWLTPKMSSRTTGLVTPMMLHPRSVHWPKGPSPSWASTSLGVRFGDSPILLASPPCSLAMEEAPLQCSEDEVTPWHLLASVCGVFHWHAITYKPQVCWCWYLQLLHFISSHSGDKVDSNKLVKGPDTPNYSQVLP